MSDELDNIMRKKMMASIVTQVNAYGGSINLTASTVCTASKSFINDKLESSINMKEIKKRIKASMLQLM